MDKLPDLPPGIAGAVQGLFWHREGIGESGAKVYMFEDMALKVQKATPEAAKERQILRWLEGRLPAPRVLEFETLGEREFLLMTRIPGQMACSGESLEDMETTVSALTEGLRALWAVDFSDCPFRMPLRGRLEAARSRLEATPPGPEDVNAHVLKKYGYTDLFAVLGFLEANRPDEELCFTHGDYCLPNVFLLDGVFSGLIDLGSGGVADRWHDIALCLRSMEYNLCYLGGRSQREYKLRRAQLFAELGLRPDEEKLRYYTLLDEFS